MYDEVIKPRIYVDASVVGGCEDEEFPDYSVLLMQRFVKGELVLVVSAITLQELAPRLQLCESAQGLSDA